MDKKTKCQNPNIKSPSPLPRWTSGQALSPRGEGTFILSFELWISFELGALAFDIRYSSESLKTGIKGVPLNLSHMSKSQLPIQLSSNDVETTQNRNGIGDHAPLN